jgi:hypothetical protein
MRKGRKSRYKQVGENLRERPNQWALVHESQNASDQYHVRRSLGNGFEVTRRLIDSNSEATFYQIYARFIGEAK